MKIILVVLALLGATGWILKGIEESRPTRYRAFGVVMDFVLAVVCVIAAISFAIK